MHVEDPINLHALLPAQAALWDLDEIPTAAPGASLDYSFLSISPESAAAREAGDLDLSEWMQAGDPANLRPLLVAEPTLASSAPPGPPKSP